MVGRYVRYAEAPAIEVDEEGPIRRLLMTAPDARVLAHYGWQKR